MKKPLVLMLAAFFAATVELYSAPAIGTTQACPTGIAVGSSTSVTITSAISDPAVIPTSVNLLRLSASGAASAIGQLNDNGANGDLTAGDRVFTGRVSFKEAQAGSLRLQVSAAFKAVSTPAVSEVMTIAVRNRATDLVGIWDGNIWRRYAATGSWVLIAGAGAVQVAAGDLDGDGLDDLVATWPNSGVWVRYSLTGNWASLSTAVPQSIASGDLDGDGKSDVLGVFDGKIWCRYSTSRSWVLVGGTGAKQVAAGDLDGDGLDDLIVTWLNNGVWAKNSLTGRWTSLSYTIPQSIATGVFDGDGKSDILGIWDGNIWCRYSAKGTGVLIAGPGASEVAAGDLDGDGIDDPIGTWQSGLWVKYSQSGRWVSLSTTAPRAMTTMSVWR